MNDIHDPEEAQTVICRCSGTTTGQIKRLVDKGVVDLDGISRATGACSGCGGCESDIVSLLAGWSRDLVHEVGEGVPHPVS